MQKLILLLSAVIIVCASMITVVEPAFASLEGFTSFLDQSNYIYSIEQGGVVEIGEYDDLDPEEREEVKEECIEEGGQVIYRSCCIF